MRVWNMNSDSYVNMNSDSRWGSCPSPVNCPSTALGKLAPATTSTRGSPGPRSDLVVSVGGAAPLGQLALGEEAALLNEAGQVAPEAHIGDALLHPARAHLFP